MPLQELAYHTRDGSYTIMTFPNMDMGVEWFASTNQIRRELENIIFVATSDDVMVPHVVDWLHRYIDQYLRRWGSDMVAADVRLTAENRNASLPEDRRLEIPANVTGTAVGCRITDAHPPR